MADATMNSIESPFVPDADVHELPVVLVVDDEVRAQEAMRRTLEEEFRVITVSDADSARAQLARRPVQVILCDHRMPGQTGVEFLREMREAWPDVVRILVSGYTDSQDIIAGINEAGIYQYVLKPWSPDHLLNTVKGAVEASHLQRGLQRLELDLRAGGRVLQTRKADKLREVRRAFDFDRLVRAVGSPLDAVCDDAARVARYDLPVLVLGESGTGKELLARAIHCASPRMGSPFVVVNCGAVPDSLLEAELFGHKRGAFTGAVEDRVGLFQQAHGGTLFLDEIGETSPAFQVKLLRVLQEGEIRPVGSARTISVDVRLVAATHRNLEDDVRAGRFREDLYYRVAGVTLQMPSLRERPADILPIAEQLLIEVAAELGRPRPVFDDDCRALLMGYPWPGNIRELRNELARAMALCDATTLPARALSRRLQAGQAGGEIAELQAAARQSGAPLPSSGSLQDRLDAVEAMLLREVMLRLHWNKSKAAQELGLSRNGLRAKLVRFGLEEA
jgi:two-component system response regulator HupR/HoxA